MNPICVKYLKVDDLSPNYKKAIQVALQRWQWVTDVRVETYTAADIEKLVGDVWDWPVYLDSVDRPEDRQAVRCIMNRIKKEGVWPYVSFRARDMQELMEVDIQPGIISGAIGQDCDTDVSVLNHGDGWHRIIAQMELKCPTIDILFVVE